MKRGALLSCFSLSLVFISVSAIRDLNSINDLRNIAFGHRYPRHGLMLLYWFANNIEIDQNDRIRLNFNPIRGDYGFHPYNNYVSDQNTQRRALPVLPHSNRAYFSLGNLNNMPSMFPPYVTQAYSNSGYSTEGNQDRIVIEIQSNQMQSVYGVFITQHYGSRSQGSGYDPDNTFRVTPHLLRQIRALNTDTCDSNDPMQSHIQCQYWAYQVTMEHYGNTGLAWFLALAGYDSGNSIAPSCSKKNQNRHPRSLDPGLKCEAVNRMKLEVKCAPKGYARITWSGIPENILKMKGNIGIYKENQSPEIHPLSEKPYGSIESSWSLNSGLQVKLSTSNNEILWVGPEFNDANSVLPTDVRGYEASLQLFTKDGYALARLFIKKSFSNWQTVLKDSWVGFYSNPSDDTSKYNIFQWSIKFINNTKQRITDEYDVYEYGSNIPMNLGIHLRFLNDKYYTDERARTEPWDCAVNPVHDELRKKSVEFLENSVEEKEKVK